MELKGRKIFGGKATGEALVCKDGISFFGGVDPETGIVIEKDHPLESISVAGKILVFPQGKGSTVGSYALYQMKKYGVAPKAIINKECEIIVAVGAIISEIPCIDLIEIEKIPNDKEIELDADEGIVLI